MGKKITNEVAPTDYDRSTPSQNHQPTEKKKGNNIITNPEKPELDPRAVMFEMEIRNSRSKW